GMRSIRGARWCWSRAYPVGSQSSRSMAGGRCLWGLGARLGRRKQPGSAASDAVGAGHHGVFTTEWSCGYGTPAQHSAPGGGALLVGRQLLLELGAHPRCRRDEVDGLGRIRLQVLQLLLDNRGRIHSLAGIEDELVLPAAYGPLPLVAPN